MPKPKTQQELATDNLKEEQERQEAAIALSERKGQLSPLMQKAIDRAMLGYLQEQVKEAIRPTRQPLKPVEVRRLRYDLQLLQSQAVYLTDITLKFGRGGGRIIFDPGNLGISEQLATAVEDAGIRMTVKVNTRLQLAKSRLNTERQSILNELLLPFGGMRVLQAEKLLDWEIRTHKLFVLMEAERNRVLRWYDTSLLDYCIRIGDCVEIAGYRGEEAEEIMEHYVRQFPSRQLIYDSISLEIMPLIKLPSIKEAMQEDAELAKYAAVAAQAQAQKARADAQARLAREMEEAERRAAQQTETMLRDRVRQIADDMSFHYLTLVQRALQGIEESGYEPTEEQRNQFNRAMQRIEGFLLSENKNLSEMFQKMQGLQKIFGEEVTGSQVETKRQELRSQIDKIFSEHMNDFIDYKVTAPGRRATALQQGFDDLDDDDFDDD